MAFRLLGSFRAHIWQCRFSYLLPNHLHFECWWLSVTFLLLSFRVFCWCYFSCCSWLLVSPFYWSRQIVVLHPRHLFASAVAVVGCSGVNVVSIRLQHSYFYYRQDRLRRSVIVKCILSAPLQLSYNILHLCCLKLHLMFLKGSVTVYPNKFFGWTWIINNIFFLVLSRYSKNITYMRE